MKRFIVSFIALTALLLWNGALAEEEAPQPVPQTMLACPFGRFVDADGTGINDLAPDHDGDGIVNCLDPDYQPPGWGRGRGAQGCFVDADADGINDLAPDHDGDGIANCIDPDYQAVQGGRWGRGGRGGWRRGIGWRRMQDADGDGISNGQDEDFVAPCLGGRGRMGLGRGGRGGAGGGAAKMLAPGRRSATWGEAKKQSQ